MDECLERKAAPGEGPTLRLLAPASHRHRGISATTVTAARMQTAANAQWGNTIRAPHTAPASCSTMSAMVTAPGTATVTCFLSPGVPNTVGSPISTSTATTDHATEYDASPHGTVTHAISSVSTRSTAGTRPRAVRFGEVAARSDIRRASHATAGPAAENRANPADWSYGSVARSELAAGDHILCRCPGLSVHFSLPGDLKIFRQREKWTLRPDWIVNTETGAHIAVRA